MTDLLLAKSNLSGHTLCLVKGESCIISDKRGIAPLMGFLEEGVDLCGYSAADLIVGKASAMLFVKCGVKKVFAKTLSEAGKRILEEHGVAYEYETLTEQIINRAGTDVCPMEKALQNTWDIEEGYSILKNKLREMAAHK